ncbi:hypothetical protein [Microbacterium sp. XT11]|nr:hypothetical protein [Microbacterium sp. XT11]
MDTGADADAVARVSRFLDVHEGDIIDRLTECPLLAARPEEQEGSP